MAAPDQRPDASFQRRDEYRCAPRLLDGDLADVQAMVDKGQFKADVIDFELPKAVQACKDDLLEKIAPAILPPGAMARPRARFRARINRPLLDRQPSLFPGDGLCPGLKKAPVTLADFFDTQKFPGRRALSRASAKLTWRWRFWPMAWRRAMSTRRCDATGLDRASQKLKALNPIWAHDSVGALEWLKDGHAVMTTALNGDVANLKDFTPA